jgi:hypothetical protein
MRRIFARLDDPELGEFAKGVIDYYSRVEAATELAASLRLAAVAHAYVLADDSRARCLRPYYATCGGNLDPNDPAFDVEIDRVIDVLGLEILERALSWRVQTNETARGLCWLLPMSVLDVEAVHLIELGASAGLNLYAEQRGYALLEGERRVTFGKSEVTQFEIAARGAGALSEMTLNAPEVKSRIGADRDPVSFEDEGAIEALRACIWGDKAGRFERLAEGLALHQRARAGELSPVAEVQKVELPDELRAFLERAVPERPEGPIVLFNTYVTAYFNDVDLRQLEREVRKFAREHALVHRVPWAWIRFEPPRLGEDDGPRPAWCRWRVELWRGTEHAEIELGWAHPHMAQIEFGPGLDRLVGLR